ncbi:Eukaryotic translation initiation factor 4E [Astathelohania contejeani]|uniref:Eukaryotic translation initiation factor 4E n=1 Tax=Astathelohania contejeani TaxID=164912 RepID=A0ABQ7HZC4_9MICR|nr:Eukaryotic translation initiation factor 4E [Thelohania contejeani]
MVEDNYPLNESWKIWYDVQSKRSTQTNWLDNLVDVCTISDVPSFLFAIEELEEPDMWPLNSNIHFFREGILPMWEDPRNSKGGKWVLELSKADTYDLTSIWRDTMALCVSEMVENDLITGCVYSPRKNVDRIALWTKDTQDGVLKCGEIWKGLMDLPEGVTIGFKIHENAIKGFKDKIEDLYII